MSSFFPNLAPKFGDDWPKPESGYDNQVRYWLEAAYEEAKSEQAQNEEIRKVNNYIDYIIGKQWPKGRPNYKASPVDNRIWKLLWELVGLLTDIKPIFEIKATDKTYDNHSSVMNKTLRSWWLDSDADMKLAMIIIYAILTTGFAKLEWNDELQNGEGDLDLVPLGPNDLLLLKPRHTLQSSQAVIYQTIKPLGFFRHKYPLRGHLVQADPNYSRFSIKMDKPGHLPSMIYDNLSPAMKRVVGNPVNVQNSAYPEALYREFWITDWSHNESNVTVKMGEAGKNWAYEVLPGKRLYPRGRLIVMGGKHLMYDGPNPYWHGQYPFGMLRMNAVPWQILGLSDLNPQLPLQDIVNNILAGVLDMIKKATNPGFFAPKNAFNEAQWEAMDWSMPGMKAAYSPMSTQKPDFSPVPNVPSYVLNVLGLIMKEQDQYSTGATASQLAQKKQVPSGESLDRIKEAQQPPIRLKGRNIEVFLRDMGSQQIHNIFQFYDTKRRMWILGSEGTVFEDFDYDPGTMVPAEVKPQDHARRFKFMIQPDSLLSARRVEKAMVMMRLRLMHDVSRKSLYNALDIGLNVENEEKELKREMAEGVPLQLGKGKGQPGGALTKK